MNVAALKTVVFITSWFFMNVAALKIVVFITFWLFYERCSTQDSSIYYILAVL